MIGISMMTYVLDAALCTTGVTDRLSHVVVDCGCPQAFPAPLPLPLLGGVAQWLRHRSLTGEVSLIYA